MSLFLDLLPISDPRGRITVISSISEVFIVIVRLKNILGTTFNILAPQSQQNSYIQFKMSKLTPSKGHK